MKLLDEILERVNSLTEEKQKEIILLAEQATKDMILVPNPGPQTMAYNSKADILLFGGTPGSSKSALGLGLALNPVHKNALIVRRQFADLSGLVDDAKRLLSQSGRGLNGFVSGNRPSYTKPTGGKIYFEGLETKGGIDYGKQGRPFDLIYVDEGAQLPQEAVLMLVGWLRTVDPTQRTRLVIGTNPPLDSTGDWMCEFFAPWLDDTHANPAKCGELRYFIMDESGQSQEVESEEEVVIDGKTYKPHSRSVIRSTHRDNPYIDSEAYEKKLQLIPEPQRSILLNGEFMNARGDQDFQVIPTQWVKDAVDRWKKHPYPPEGVPMCNIGVDIAMGGKDKTVISMRYDYWFDGLIKVEGKNTPYGRDVAGHIIQNRRDNAEITLDMSGGFGSGAYECLIDNLGKNFIKSYKGGESTTKRTRDRQFSFFNVRSAAYYLFREALDPNQIGGACICLPDDRELISDLTAPTFQITTRGIQITPKNKLIEKMGRSPDCGDAVVMAFWNGRIGINPERKVYNDMRMRGQGFNNLQKTSNMGYSNRRRKA